MTDAESMLQVAAADLGTMNVPWALIGGLAVSFRTEPRFTRDVDFAVAVPGDAEAEAVVHRMGALGYGPVQVFEHDYPERMSIVRLARRGGVAGVIVDLLFASTGIEAEIVAAAVIEEVFPGVSIPVATVPHLIVMKALAGRNQDLTDLEYLIPAASDADLAEARDAALLIRERGFRQDQDVVSDLEFYIEQAGRLS